MGPRQSWGVWLPSLLGVCTCDMPVWFGGVWGGVRPVTSLVLPILPTPSFYNLVQCLTEEAECQAYKTLLNCCTSCETICT